MLDRTKINYIIFFVVSFIIIFGYSAFFAPKPAKKATTNDAVEEKPAELPPADEKLETPLEEYVIPDAPTGELISIKSPLVQGTIDTAGGRIVEWKLLNFRETTARDSPPVDLFEHSPPSYNVDLRLEGFEIPSIIPFQYNGPKELALQQNDQEIALYWKSPEGIEVRKIYTINPISYLLEQRFEVRNATNRPIKQKLSIQWYGEIENSGRTENNKSFISMVSDEVDRIESTPKETTLLQGQVNWFGFSDKYFMTVFLPEIGSEARISLSPAGSDNLALAVFGYPSDIIPQGSTSIHSSKSYLGPMEYRTLQRVGYGLQNAVDFGWFGTLARPVGLFLTYINDYFHNYGVSIIVITVLIRLIFLPLTLKSMGSMKEVQAKMQQIKPKIDELKEKYKDDKTKQNSELMKLYSSYGINPLSSLGGCLPLLIQLPVFIALYDVLLHSINLRHSSFLWIKDLAEPETLFDIPGIGIPFRILPLAMGASWYLSQKMTPTTAPGADNMQMKMMQFMPLIFTVMFWGLPSGLILYWTVSNVLSIGQQLYVNRRKVPKGGTSNADSARKRRKDSV